MEGNGVGEEGVQPKVVQRWRTPRLITRQLGDKLRQLGVKERKRNKLQMAVYYFGYLLCFSFSEIILLKDPCLGDMNLHRFNVSQLYVSYQWNNNVQVPCLVLACLQRYISSMLSKTK